MEKICTAAGRAWLVPTLLVASLLLSGTLADGETKKAKDPRANVNLSPFEKWISVGECLRNTSQICDKYTLTIEGWMNVTSADGEAFCQDGGCKDHTLAVLACIHDVKRDIRFGSRASLQDINTTINHGCSYGFNGKTVISGSGSSLTSKSRTAFAASVALVIGLFYDWML